MKIHHSIYPNSRRRHSIYQLALGGSRRPWHFSASHVLTNVGSRRVSSYKVSFHQLNYTDGTYQKEKN